ncbi:MAG: helix-turn-helix domain-containing protein [Actinomycetota bacterium]|nr:helix-turn-helix domain-containing protein [Actinomycetota bacterium]
MRVTPASDRIDLVMLGQRIEAARVAAGRSARSVAEAAGISSVYLRVIERGQNPATGKPSRPTRTILAALAQELELDTEMLYRLAGYAPPSGRSAGVQPPAPVPADPAISDLAWHGLSAREFAHLCLDLLERLGFTAREPQMDEDVGVIQAARVAEISNEVQEWLVVCRHGEDAGGEAAVDDFLARTDESEQNYHLFMTSSRLPRAAGSRIIAAGEAMTVGQAGYLDRPMIEDLCSPYTEIVTEYFARTASVSQHRAVRRAAYFAEADRLWRSTSLPTERLGLLRRNLARHREADPEAFSPRDDVIYTTQRHFVEYTDGDPATFRTTVDVRLANIGNGAIARDRQMIFGVQPVVDHRTLDLRLFSADPDGPPVEPRFALDTERRKVIELDLPRDIEPEQHYDYSIAFSWPCGGSLEGLRFQEVPVLCFVGHLVIDLRFPRGWAPVQTQLFERQRIRPEHHAFIWPVQREQSYDVAAEIDLPSIGTTYKLSCMLRRQQGSG